MSADEESMVLNTNTFDDRNRAVKTFGLHTHLLPTVKDGACTCFRGGDCPYPGKHPLETGWQEKSKPTVSVPVEVYENYNVGFRTGVEFEAGKKLVVLDGDGPEGCRWIESFLGHLETRAMVSRRGRHYYFWVPGACGDLQPGQEDGTDKEADP